MRIRMENFQNNGIYHLYNRTVNDELLFRNDDDFIKFLQLFKVAIFEIPISVLSYCLMPNHFHFLIQQKSKMPIYKIFNKLFCSYVPWYNKKYSRKGRLLGNKLQHKKITNEDYLVLLCQYIHTNPIKAGLVTKPKDWPFSNYLEFVGLRNGSLCDHKFISDTIEQFDDYENIINEYQKFLNTKKFNTLLFDN